MEIEGLLKKIEHLTPQFGRASDDLSSLVSRGRAADYKGVLQNSRLVLEMLLREGRRLQGRASEFAPGARDAASGDGLDGAQADAWEGDAG
jgi:hypothetical protein